MRLTGPLAEGKYAAVGQCRDIIVCIKRLSYNAGVVLKRLTTARVVIALLPKDKYLFVAALVCRSTAISNVRH